MGMDRNTLPTHCQHIICFIYKHLTRWLSCCGFLLYHQVSWYTVATLQLGIKIGIFSISSILFYFCHGMHAPASRFMCLCIHVCVCLFVNLISQRSSAGNFECWYRHGMTVYQNLSAGIVLDFWINALILWCDLLTLNAVVVNFRLPEDNSDWNRSPCN